MTRKSFFKSLIGITGIGTFLGLSGINHIFQKRLDILDRINGAYKQRPFYSIKLGKSEMDEIRNIAFYPQKKKVTLLNSGTERIIGISLHTVDEDIYFEPFNFLDELKIT